MGRTGTFIAVDRLLQHIRDHDDVDVYSTILDMRNYRCNMVQTEVFNCDPYAFLGPSQGFWGTGKNGIYFRGTGEQRPNFAESRGRKTILGNISKQIFDFGGIGEQANLFLGNKGTGTPFGGPHFY